MTRTARDGPHYLHGVLFKSDRSNYLTQYDQQTQRLRKEDDAYGRVVSTETDKRREVRFAGSGGQGLILSGIILAEAAVAEGLERGAKPKLWPGGSRRFQQMRLDSFQEQDRIPQGYAPGHFGLP